MDLTEADPKGLVRESYAIEGISAEECRSIFLDWALSLPVDCAVPDAVRVLLAHYAPAAPDHPMNRVLGQGLDMPQPTRRKGGRAARVGPGD